MRSTRRHGAKQARRGSAIPFLLAIFVVAMGARLLVLGQLEHLPLFRTPQLDSLEYRLRAERILAGDPGGPAPRPHAPGYSYFAAGVFRVFGDSVAALGAVQSVLGALTCVLVAALAWRWWGRTAGLAAGLLLAVNAPAIVIGESMLAEGLLAFLLMLSVWCFERRRHRSLAVALAGGLVGLAAFVRPTALLLLPVLLVAVLMESKGDRHRGWVPAAVLVAGAAIVLAPASIHAWRRGQAVLPMQANAGLNFYLGNSPLGRGVASGRFGGSWDAVAGEALRHGKTTPEAQDAYYFRKTFAEIRSRPARYLALVAKKTALTFQAVEVRDSHSLAFFRDQIPLLRWLPGFGVLLGFAAVGAVVAARRRELPFLLVGYVVVFAASCVFLVVGSRYRYPLVPMLAVVGGPGIAALVAAVRGRDWRKALSLAAAAAAVVGLSHVMRDAPSQNLAEEWYFTGNSLLTEENRPAASAAYRRALELDPSNAPAMIGLGKIALASDAWEDAESWFARATSADPGHARAHYWLAVALEHRRRLPSAGDELRASLSLRGDDVAAWGLLAQTMEEEDRFDEAERAYRELGVLRPEDASAWLGLSRALARQHKFEEALAASARATDLDPQNAEAWLLRANIALETGSVDVADQALRHAEAEAGRDQAAIGLAWARLARLRKKPEVADVILRQVLLRHPGFRPAAELLLVNAAERGRRREAEQFLSEIQKRP